MNRENVQLKNRKVGINELAEDDSKEKTKTACRKVTKFASLFFCFSYLYLPVKTVTPQKGFVFAKSVASVFTLGRVGCMSSYRNM